MFFFCPFYVVCFTICYETHGALFIRVDDLMKDYTCSIQAVCLWLLFVCELIRAIYWLNTVL